MIGKKINQLATELAPVSTDLTIIGDPTTGVSKKITLAQLGAIFSGAVSFYTNLAGFPATGDINVIYCAKDTQKLYLWSGSAYVEVFPSQALLDTYQLRSEKGNANGYASLDSQGKVPISQLPSSIMEYKGTWNASTNTPTLANGTGDTGDVYICNVAGTVDFGAGPITFAVGDYVIYSGTIWQRSSGAVGTVTSVAVSRSGDALAITGSPVTTSGTINIGFAGNSTQYINGAGNLVTFPGVINEAQNLITEVYNKTGATLTKGTIVYINGGQGNLPTITKALATGDSTSAQTYGIVRNDITNNNNGYVVVAGRISDLDTQAYTEGTQLYLSPTTAGTFTSTKPYAPNHLVYVGIVVRAHPTQGVIEVKIQNGYEMDELHNVAAQTPTNNDGLFWEASTSLWKNKSIATILGYTPQAQLNGTGFVKASGTTITYDNSTYLTTSAAATTYLPLVLSSTTNFVDINGQQFSIYGSAGGYTSGRIIVDPVFSAIGYQNAGVFDGLKILTNGNAEFSNSGVTRFFNQVRFDSTLTNGTYTYTLPGATGTIALTSQLTGGTVTSVGLSSATSGVTIGSTPITTSGTITLAIATASGSQQGLLSSTDWNTFNNKQSALTNPVTGTGTTNYLPKFTGTSTIGNSTVFDNESFVGIGRTTNASAGWNLAVQNGLTVTQGTTETQLFGYFGDAGVGTYSNHNFKIRVNNTDRAVFDTSGNLGLGVTPSAWGSSSKALQIGSSAAPYLALFQQTTSTSDGYLGWGAYLTGDRTFAYTTTGDAVSLYRLNAGNHVWFTAPSGTAGNAISFTQAMTLDASGRLGIGTTSPGARLDILGSSGNVTTDMANGTLINIDGGSISSTNFGVGLAFVRTGSQMAYIKAARENTSNEAGFLAFATQNSAGSHPESMRITSTGNVGIGTTSPVNYTNYRSLHIAGTSTNSSAILYLTNSDSSIRGLFFAEGTANRVTIGSQSNHDFTFLTNDTERMRITSGGNVGIGTTSPSGKLGIYGSAIGDIPLVITHAWGGSSTALISASNASAEVFKVDRNGAATFSGDVKVKTLEITNVGTYGSSAGISTYMAITVNGQNYVIPLHGTP
jgi:hypothetical protein